MQFCREDIVMLPDKENNVYSETEQKNSDKSMFLTL